MLSGDLLRVEGASGRVWACGPERGTEGLVPNETSSTSSVPPSSARNPWRCRNVANGHGICTARSTNQIASALVGLLDPAHPVATPRAKAVEAHADLRAEPEPDLQHLEPSRRRREALDERGISEDRIDGRRRLCNAVLEHEPLHGWVRVYGACARPAASPPFFRVALPVWGAQTRSPCKAADPAHDRITVARVV